MRMRTSELLKLVSIHEKAVREELDFADAELRKGGFYEAVPYRGTVRGHVRRARKYLDGTATLTPGARAQLKWAITQIID